MLVRHNLPSFVGVLELPRGWNDTVFGLLTADVHTDHLDQETGTLWRHRGMPTLRDQWWHERSGWFPLPLKDPAPARWDVSLPGDGPVGLPPGTLDRVELGIPENMAALVFTFHLAHGETPPIAHIEALVGAMEDLADRLGADRGRADLAPRFLSGGCEWFWRLDGPRRGALLPMRLEGPWGAFVPHDWPQPHCYDDLYEEQDIVVMAGFDAGAAGWTDAWLERQPRGSLAHPYWQNRFAEQYNGAPRIPGTECRVSALHRNVIIGRPMLITQLRWHEAGTTPVEGATPAVESMQRLLDAQGVPQQAAVHVVVEVDDGD